VLRFVLLALLAWALLHRPIRACVDAIVALAWLWEALSIAAAATLLVSCTMWSLRWAWGWLRPLVRQAPGTSEHSAAPPRVRDLAFFAETLEEIRSLPEARRVR